MKPPVVCDCSSGQFRFPLRDGYGIFLCYVCDRCIDMKLKRFRPDIMERYEAEEPIELEE
jgi:hypothetical protein